MALFRVQKKTPGYMVQKQQHTGASWKVVAGPFKYSTSGTDKRRKLMEADKREYRDTVEQRLMASMPFGYNVIGEKA